MSLKLAKEGANNLEIKAGKSKIKQYSIRQSTCTLEEIDITMYKIVEKMRSTISRGQVKPD